jgi:putative heme-binding domain-containing protein
VLTRHALGLLVAVCLSAPAQLAFARQATPAKPRAPSPPVPNTAAGKRIFDAQCAWCHGTDGDGGTGPNLHGRLRHATTYASIVEIVVNGIPGTEMPSFRLGLTDQSTRQVAAYVQTLTRGARTAAPGNAQRGAALYAASGCAGCHVIGGSGGTLGPELTEIGARRGPAHLREALVRPEASHPPGYLVVRATPAAGPDIRGIRVNEDVFWIQIRDAAGTVHSLEKAQLKTLERQLDATLMPSYARLAGGELDDLIAYLMTLRGER